MMKLMQQAQQLQARAKKIQEEIARREFSASAADGKIQVTLSGEGEMLALRIDPEWLRETPDVEMVADFIVMASREAFQKGRQAIQQEMGQLTAQLGLPPGLF
ncbi:MAG: YbaB/EbfC family nucleoid-associated protein [Methylacidiphilales bacterium]|nr:YbaB/EbfC family nucleoid-associated protein [Candidatus Methylacidiphilales bacterium]